MNNKKRIIKISILLISILAITLLISRFYFQSEEIEPIKKAFEKISQTDSVKANLILDTFIDSGSIMSTTANDDDLDQPVIPTYDLPLTVSGPIEIKYSTDGPLVGSAELDFTTTGGLSILKASIIISNNGQFFIKLNNLPSLNDDSQIDLDQLNNQWFSANAETMASIFPWVGQVQKNNNVTGRSLSAGVIRNNMGGWLYPYHRFEDTLFKGRSVAHYEMFVDNNNFGRLLSAITQSMRGYQNDINETELIENYIKYRRFIVEAWVDKATSQLVKLEFGIFPNEWTYGAPVAFSLEFIDFNNEVNYLPPENFSEMSDLFMNIMNIPISNHTSSTD